MSLCHSLAHDGYLHPYLELGYLVISVVELVTGQFEGLADHFLCGGVILKFDVAFSQEVEEEDADGGRVCEEG